MKTTICKLKINLTNKSVEKALVPAGQLSLEERLGGFGLAVHDFAKHLEQNPELRDAYNPNAPIYITTGFLTGTKVMTAKRTYICGLSPQKTSKAGTNGIFYSAASGDFGPKLAALGIDSVEIIGKSETPVYLVFDSNGVHFQDATNLLEKTTDEKILALAEMHPSYASAAIGPAAENGVRFANIALSTHDQIKNKSGNLRFAGRGGMGSALWNKNLVAVVAGGGESVTNHDVGDVLALNKEIATGKRTAKYKAMGTMFGNIEQMDGVMGVNVHENFSHGSSPQTAALFKPNLLQSGHTIKDKGCLCCGIKCWKEINKDGKSLGKVDFEPGMLLGPNLGIYEIEKVMELIRIVDNSGVDAITAGACLGYEMEQKNNFGDFDFAKDLLLQIIAGKHPLKDGLMRYAGNAPSAMHVKGVELPAYPGNFNPGYAFAIRGGDHMSMDTYNGAWYPGAVNDLPEWIENIIRGPQIINYDLNGACKFAKVTFGEVAELYSRIFGGEKPTEDGMRDVAKRVYRLARGIDAKLGFTSEDDVMPEKCFEPYVGSRIKPFMTQDFFSQVKKGVEERLADAEKSQRK